MGLVNVEATGYLVLSSCYKSRTGGVVGKLFGGKLIKYVQWMVWKSVWKVSCLPEKIFNWIENSSKVILLEFTIALLIHTFRKMSIPCKVRNIIWR